VIKISDLIKEDDTRRIKDVLRDIDSDLSVLKFNVGSIPVKCFLDTSDISVNNNLQFMIDIYLKMDEQIPSNIFLEIFKHLYDGCIKHGLHKFEEGEFGSSYIGFHSTDIKIGDTAQFSLRLSQILPPTIKQKIETRIPLWNIFGKNHLKSSSDPSYDNINSAIKSQIEQKLVIPPNVLPKFSESFKQYRIKLIKKAKAIYRALSKNKIDGIPYELNPLKDSDIFLRTNEYDIVDKNKNINPTTFVIEVLSDFKSFNGKSIDDIRKDRTEYDKFYQKKQSLAKVFEKFGIVFIP
jgi:hypothetical protein